MILYLARHGETDINAEKRSCGRIDAHINDLGKKQAEQMVAELPSGISVIYCSSLIRTQQTAEIFNESLRLPIKIAEELTERDFGSLSGKYWDEWDNELRRLDKQQEYNYRPYGGESVSDVKDRLVKFVNMIKVEHEQPVLAVTSGGIIRLMYWIMSDEPLTHIPNGSVHKFEI